MNYLYALMGIAMISSISTMIQIATSLRKHSLDSNPPVDLYFQSNSIAPEMDRVFLGVLSRQADEEWPLGEPFCSKLKSEATKVSALAGMYSIGPRSESEHPKLIHTCTLTNSNHRIIVSYRNPNKNKYGLFSCITKSQYYCDFEE